MTVGLLLPLFFAYFGLNTQIGLVNSWSLAGVAGLILVTACVGKAVPCWLAARLHGEPPDQALAIGVLIEIRAASWS